MAEHRVRRSIRGACRDIIWMRMKLCKTKEPRGLRGLKTHRSDGDMTLCVCVVG